MINHDIVHDLRAMAANPEQFTKNEMVEMLEEAAVAIEADHKALEKVRAAIMDALGHLEKYQDRESKKVEVAAAGAKA
jgi:hypothetical protein